jgi:hypothetical protein
MNMVLKTSGRLLLASAAAVLGLGAVGAQETSPAAAPTAAPAPHAANASKSNALIDAGEPRADTSAPVAPAAGAATPGAATPGAMPTGAATPGAATTGAAVPGAAAPGKSAAHPAEARPPAVAPHAASATPAPNAAGPKPPTAADRLDLNTATVTGDREQPKVMYIVPWKKADIGDLSGKPMNSLLDEALAPVDRDEFRREVAYYEAVQGDSPQNGAARTAPQGEK